MGSRHRISPGPYPPVACHRHPAVDGNARGAHHLGRPFLTAYQLAILLKKHHPGDFERIGHEVGGRGSNLSYSLSGCLAGQLSRRIKSGEITDIEGGFLSNCRLKLVQFDDYGETVTSSMTGGTCDLSMFRLRG